MGELRMSVEERKRLAVMSRVQEGALQLVRGADLLGVSYRQGKRIWERFRTEGDAGLVHRLRGKRSNRAHPGKEAILKRYAERYGDFGPTLAVEYLVREGWQLRAETLRRWLKAEGLVAYRTRRRGRHRQWRPRRACFGELIQIDGSVHDWLEGRGPRLTLMVMIDDATNRTLAQFYPAETTEAAMDLFEQWVRRYGLPLALYPDQDSIYVINRPASLEEQLAQEKPLTQFGRAMKGLGVRLDPAGSPQAKGRVERRHGLFQDRLLRALRLEGIRDLQEANRYLKTKFLPLLNRRWTLSPAQPADLHRPVPPGTILHEVLSIEESRTVAQDYTVQFESRFLQILRSDTAMPRPRARITVRRLRSGALQLLYQNRKLPFVCLPDRPRTVQAPSLSAPGKHRSSPAANHPWRRYRAAPSSPRAPGGYPPGAPPPVAAVSEPRGHSYCVKKGDISIVV